jgi:hypothetical protein
MLKIIFRLLFLGLGLFVTVAFGKDAFLPVWHIPGKSVPAPLFRGGYNYGGRGYKWNVEVSIFH